MNNSQRPLPAALQVEPKDRKMVANYIAELSGDLSDMAHRHSLETLAFILEMAKLEAENIARGLK